MRLSESQTTRVFDQLRSYHHLLAQLEQITGATEAKALRTDAALLLDELETNALLEVAHA